MKNEVMDAIKQGSPKTFIRATLGELRLTQSGVVICTIKFRSLMGPVIHVDSRLNWLVFRNRNRVSMLHLER